MEAEERKTAMSHDEMQDYWKTLCSFTGEDIPNEVNQLMIIRTYLDYPIEVVARKLKVRPNTISKARRKIARELRKKLV